MIRTGNPQFADILVYNATKTYNASCLGTLLEERGGGDEDGKDQEGAKLFPEDVELCASGKSKSAQV